MVSEFPINFILRDIVTEVCDMSAYSLITIQDLWGQMSKSDLKTWLNISAYKEYIEQVSVNIENCLFLASQRVSNISNILANFNKIFPHMLCSFLLTPFQSVKIQPI